MSGKGTSTAHSYCLSRRRGLARVGLRLTGGIACSVTPWAFSHALKFRSQIFRLASEIRQRAVPNLASSRM